SGELAGLVGALSDVVADRGSYSEAEGLARRALDLIPRSREGDLDLAGALSRLGFLYQREGKLADARPLFENALEVEQRVSGSDDPKVAARLAALAGLHQDQADLAGAEPLLARALSIVEARYGPDHLEAAGPLARLGICLLDEDRPDQAEPLLQRALALHER